MPVVASSYRPPRRLPGGHAQTLAPSLWRRVVLPAYRRERLELPDGDFLDLDWLRRPDPADRLVVVSHGLEGSSARTYVRGMVAAFRAAGWDALAWNCRSCSGPLNRLPRLYHHADADDLAAVVAHAAARYPTVALVGFSLGGSQTLRYLAAYADRLPEAVRAAVAFSVPVDLAASAASLYRFGNGLYRRRFLGKLKAKIAAKAAQFPDLIDTRGLSQICRFDTFDDRYTAPLHGFASAQDFYNRANLRPFLPAIRVPTLLVNALNDPMLPAACFPYDLARDHAHLHLETPRSGGHVGFSEGPPGAPLWSERRAEAFVEAVVG